MTVAAKAMPALLRSARAIGGAGDGFLGSREIGGYRACELGAGCHAGLPEHLPRVVVDGGGLRKGARPGGAWRRLACRPTRNSLMVDQEGFEGGASTLRLVGREDVARTGEDFQAGVGEDGSHAT